jgi:hypothetical protein
MTTLGISRRHFLDQTTLQQHHLTCQAPSTTSTTYSLTWANSTMTQTTTATNIWNPPSPTLPSSPARNPMFSHRPLHHRLPPSRHPAKLTLHNRPPQLRLPEAAPAQKNRNEKLVKRFNHRTICTSATTTYAKSRSPARAILLDTFEYTQASGRSFARILAVGRRSFKCVAVSRQSRQHADIVSPILAFGFACSRTRTYRRKTSFL